MLEITATACNHRATLDTIANVVEIYDATTGALVATGRWNGTKIVDCPVWLGLPGWLGLDAKRAREIYNAISSALYADYTACA